jgi:phage-related minor tail protein
MEALRSALTDLTKRAAALLAESGHPATPDLMRRITTTLEALATYGTQPGAPPAGRLTADVDPPGFEALSALVPRSKGKRGTRSEPPRVLQFRPPSKGPAKTLSPAAKKRQEEKERKAQHKAAMVALREAERTLRDARKAVAKSQAALRKVAARAKVTEKAKAALEKRFEKVSADADAARQDARRVASAAEDAAQSLQDAEYQVKTLKSKVESNL